MDRQLGDAIMDHAPTATAKGHASCERESLLTQGPWGKDFDEKSQVDKCEESSLVLGLFLL